MEQERVEPAQAFREFLRQIRPANIEPPGHEQPDQGHDHGRAGQCVQQFHRGVRRYATGFAGSACERSSLFDSRLHRIGRENRMQKRFEIIGLAQKMRRREPAAKDRKERQNHQRDSHASRRFVDVHFVFVVARFAEERQENETKHIKRSQARADQAQQPERKIRMWPRSGRVQDFVLAEKTCEAGNSRDSQCGNEHRPISDRNFLTQPAHLAHVLLAGHGMNHAARRQKEQALEESVGHQVKNSRGVRAHTAAQKHVPQLRDSRIGENFFDVRLHQANRSRVERRKRSHQRHYEHRNRRARK